MLKALKPAGYFLYRYVSSEKKIYVLSLYSVNAFFMNLRGKNECIQMQCMFVFIIPRRNVFSVRYEINLTSLVV